MSVDTTDTERIHADSFGAALWPFFDLCRYVKLEFFKGNWHHMSFFSDTNIWPTYSSDSGS